MAGMGKPYGKLPKRTATKSKARKPPTTDAVKYHIRGKDDAPLTMPEVQQGFYELAKSQQEHAHLRVARLDVYVRYIDEQGRPAGIGQTEISIYPYRSAADEHGA
jgi:hypothetical protein